MGLGAAASLAAVMLWQGWSAGPASDANAPSNVAKSEIRGKNLGASQSAAPSPAAPSPAPAAGRDLAMVWLTSHVPSAENDPVAAELAWPALDEMANGPENDAENGDNNSALLAFDPSTDPGSETPPVVNVPNWLLSAVAPSRVEDN